MSRIYSPTFKGYDVFAVHWRKGSNVTSYFRQMTMCIFNVYVHLHHIFLRLVHKNSCPRISCPLRYWMRILLFCTLSIYLLTFSNEKCFVGMRCVYFRFFVYARCSVLIVVWGVSPLICSDTFNCSPLRDSFLVSLSACFSIEQNGVRKSIRLSVNWFNVNNVEWAIIWQRITISEFLSAPLLSTPLPTLM